MARRRRRRYSNTERGRGVAATKGRTIRGVVTDAGNGKPKPPPKKGPGSSKAAAPPSGGQRVTGGVKRRTSERLDYLEQNGGLQDLQGIRRGGVTREEAQRIKRAAQREQTFNPLQPRGGRDILRTAGSLADVAYGPQERELAQAGLNESGRQSVLYGPGGWFQKWQQDMAAAAQRQQAAETAFQAGASAVALNMAGMAGQPQAPGNMPGGAPSADMQAQSQQAAQARAAMQQQAAATLATRGASNVANVNAMAIAAGQQAQQGLMESQARQAKIQSLAQELAREKGDYTAGKVSELTEGERTYDLNRQAFGLDVAQQAETERSNRARERQNAANALTAKRQQNRNYRLAVKRLGLDKADQIFNHMEKDRRFQLDKDKFGFDKATERYLKAHGLGKYDPDNGNSNGDSDVKMDRDGDGIADAGKYKGYSESERDKFDNATNLLDRTERGFKRKDGSTYGGPGFVAGNRQENIDNLVAKGVPLRIAQRAVSRFIRLSRNRQGRGGPPRRS